MAGLSPKTSRPSASMNSSDHGSVSICACSSPEPTITTSACAAGASRAGSISAQRANRTGAAVYAPIVAAMQRYVRIDPPGEEPERLLDPEEQRSEPWSGTVFGRCDKCGGSGSTTHE